MYCSEKDCKIFKNRLLVCRECPVSELVEEKSPVEETPGEMEIAE